jgi:heme exporter protein D
MAAAMLLFSGTVSVYAALQQSWLAVGATLLALLVLRGSPNRREGRA